MNLFTKLRPLAILAVLAGFALSPVGQPVHAIRPNGLSAGAVPFGFWQREVESGQTSSPMTSPNKTETANYDVFLPMISQPMSQPAEAGWPMAGANPQRTSWTMEEVRGNLRPAWYRPIEPYIPAKVQIIAANNLVYVSTAKGLYAFDADTGAQNWVYPTEMPLGNSPTIHNGVAYVGGFDDRIHAIDALTGRGLWTFTAGAGFDTNPVVVNGIIYMGNRDGYMYAVYANDRLASGNSGMEIQN